MGMLKNYLLMIQEECSDNLFGQDAIEFAISRGLVRLTGTLETDVRLVLSNYDRICEAYRRHLSAITEIAA